uniref:PhoH-like protein n=1 Tax=viral metagenome TaxID=1070528 RepID=A0A6C0B938_9ZZZZ
MFASKKDYMPDLKSLSKFYKPKSSNQELYNQYLNDDQYKIIFAVGPAGTGKTLLACNTAIRELKRGKYQKIIITRPVVPVEEDIGFLPGNLIKKMDPWTRPIFDIFLEFYSQKDIDSMIHANVIEISPLAYMRGRTFKNALIIADEMQNSSPNQMLMLTTRIGLGSKMVITGDLNQTDRGLASGLADFIHKYKLFQNKEPEVNGIQIIELDKRDILREPIISTILDIYDVEKDKNREVSISDTLTEFNKIMNEIYEEKVELNIEFTENKVPENKVSEMTCDSALIPKKDVSKHFQEK